jgi:hypothetical protein
MDRRIPWLREAVADDLEVATTRRQPPLQSYEAWSYFWP